LDNNLRTQNRILSIDALRGFDMLLIVFADKFFIQLDKAIGSQFTHHLALQFDHPEWFGSTFYDIVMPLFLFVVGAVIPFSLSKTTIENARMFNWYKKILTRFILLFVLGWIVQGNLLAFDPENFFVFNNTLQAIAVGYFFSCLIYIHLDKKWIYIIFILCLVFYTLILTMPIVPGFGKSVLLPGRNFAFYVDYVLFGKYHDGEQYTWFLSGFGFVATTLSGVMAGELIKSKRTQQQVVINLLLFGIAGLLLGSLLGMWHPIVKKIWTSSFVLASSGVCFILLSIFYWIIDVKKYIRWSFPFRVIGINAITAYVISHLVSFPTIAKFFLFGLEQYTGAYYNMLTIIGGFGILYLLLWYMYRNKTFIKV